MLNFNIHWKGHPHRRLPRIRIAPIRGTSVRSSSIPGIVAVDSIQLRRPLGPNLERERKKQRFAFRRRRSRKSCSSSSALRTRKLASLRARQHIQVFGWDPEAASKVDTLRGSRYPSSTKLRADFRPPENPQDTASGTTIIDSHDGASGSVCRPIFSTKPVIQRENLYSLMHVAEVPVYWSAKKPVNRKKTSIASNRAIKRSGECVHVGPLDLVSRRRIYRSPQRVGRSRTYDSRIDPRALLDRERPTKSAPVNPPPTTLRTISRNTATQGSPELRRALESIAVKSKADPQSVTPSMKSIVQSLLSDSASRTASQKRALKQFTKELELYLQATKSLHKQTLVPSPSTTTVSAHTIEELRPYKGQFQSAGLAVTSADQKRESAVMAKLKKAPSPPPTPPKDDRYTARKPTARKSKMSTGGEKRQETTNPTHHHHKTESLPSFDTGTTVMDFTPPHEQTGPRTRGRRHSSMSSDHTIMAFTPPHEIPPLQPKSTPPPPPRASTKKSLPWLRNQDSTEVSPSRSPKDKGVVTASMLKAETQNLSDVLLFSGPRGSVVEKKVAPPKDRAPRGLDPQSAEVKWQDMDYRNEINAKNSMSKRKVYHDSATQVAPELSDDYVVTDQGVKYVHAATQAHFPEPAPSTVGENEAIKSCPPLIPIKSKTFPTSPNKCSGNCRQPPPRAISARSPKKQNKDQAVQTDFVEAPLNVKQQISLESKRPPSKSNPKGSGRNGTYPFTSPSLFRTEPARRSPNKSVDEAAVQRSVTRKESEKASPAVTPPHSLTHATPSSLRCIQCGAEIDPPAIEPRPGATLDPEPDIQESFQRNSDPQLELEVNSPPRTGWSHTCTARSSLECQQCASASLPPQEERPASPIRSLKRAAHQSAFRKDYPEPTAYMSPDWAAALESDFEEIIQSYHSPEEQFMQRKVIADKLAEYSKPTLIPDLVKRSSVPKLRLRPPPAIHTPPKQSHPKPAVDSLPPAPISINPPLLQSETTTSCSTFAQDSARISNKAVFRGLHVATAAACDEDVAKWIEEITGTGVRKFLADLSAFDGLGCNTLAGVAKRAAKQKRAELRTWEKIREQKMLEKDMGEGWVDCAVEEKGAHCEHCAAKERQAQGRFKDRKMGSMAVDQTVNMMEDKSARERRREEVIDGMAESKEPRSREGLRERAIRMGWRDASVSGGV